MTILVMLCGICHPDGVAAFDYLGFRSGMTLEQAKAAGAASGRPLFEVTNQPGNYSLGQGVEAKGMVYVCNDRLASVSLNIDGGVDAFASLTAEFIQKHGEPTTLARSGYTDSGLFSDVELTWATEQGESVTVIVASFKSNPYATINFSAIASLCR